MPKPSEGPEVTALKRELASAKRDIAAMLWRFKACEYCWFRKQIEYSGAVQYVCSLECGQPCTPEWRGTEEEW